MHASERIRCPPRGVSLLRASASSLALLVIASQPAAAQTPPSDPPEAVTRPGPLSAPAFARLVEGKDVWITLADGTRRKGRVVSQSERGLVVDRGPRPPVPFDRIVRLQRVTHRLRNSALIGLIAGAGFGVASALPCHDDRVCAATVIGFYAGIGTGFGAAVGAIRNVDKRSGDLIYEAAPRTTTIAVVPILSPTRTGAAFTMTWR